MNKNKIFGFVAIGACAVLILSIFLPYVSGFSISKSLWTLKDSSRVLLLILGLFPIVLYLINKKTEMSYITVGFATFYQISMLISNEGFNYLSIGFYLILLSSITLGVMTFLYKEDEATAIINLSVTKSMPQQPVQPQVNQFQGTQQTSPNYQQPVNQVYQKPTQTIVGYDPNTGAPIYSNQNINQ